MADFKNLTGNPASFPATIRTLGTGQKANEANFEACFQDVADRTSNLDDRVSDLEGGGGGGGGGSGADSYKDPVYLCATASITLSGAQTVDGISAGNGKRILAPLQATGSTRGVYISNTGGAWARASDWDVGSDVFEGTQVKVTDGTVNAGAIAVVTTADPIVVGTTALTFDVQLPSLAGDRTASGIRTAQTVVSVSASASPLVGRSLVASSSALAAWVDRPVSRVTAIPTAGHWQLGDILLWGADASRLALRVQRTGALGTVARANSTVYAENQVISSGTRVFAVAISGATAGSLPGALATAAFGDRITDGAAILECVGTVVQTPDFASVPNIDAPAVALADSSATVQVTDGPVRECATATANRTTTLGTTGAVQGDVLTFRRVANSPGAFTWTFDGTSGGGDSVQIPASTRAVVRFVLNASGVWVVRDCTGTLS